MLSANGRNRLVFTVAGIIVGGLLLFGLGFTLATALGGDEEGGLASSTPGAGVRTTTPMPTQTAARRSPAVVVSAVASATGVPMVAMSKSPWLSQ
jgi:hypothetical protein